MKPMLDAALYADCHKALGARLAPNLRIGAQVTFADRRLPGLWVYTGDSFVRPEIWNAPKLVIDYGVRPARPWHNRHGL